MKKLIEKEDKKWIIDNRWIIILLITIMGVFYSGTQIIKILSEERKVEMSYEYEREKQDALDNIERMREFNLSLCLADAEVAYYDYMELNSTSINDDGTITAKNYIWDRAQSHRKISEDLCFKKSEK